MRRFTFSFVLALLLLTAALGLMQVARGQAPEGQTGATKETQGDNMREVVAPAGSSAPQSPTIGFIDSPSVTCYQPDLREDVCYLNWYYVSVNAAPNYVLTMTLTINAVGEVAHVQGFFQTSMYVPYNMFDRGFKVSCGALGAGGNPGLGNAYAFTIRARDSAGLAAANYGTIYCPAYRP